MVPGRTNETNHNAHFLSRKKCTFPTLACNMKHWPLCERIFILYLDEVVISYLIIREKLGSFTSWSVKIHMLHYSRIIIVSFEVPLCTVPNTRTW
jgi:hypothetical protein